MARSPEQASRAVRRRRRPDARKGRPTLTRERIAEAALVVAGQEGFPALTMRRLADELGVTVRALYFYVQDRQEVVDLAAKLLQQQSPERRLDPADWRASLRLMCHEARAHYRRHPRALLISLDETVTLDGVDAARIADTEALLGFLRALGLDLPDALAIRTQLLIDLFGFALLVDYRHDRADPSQRPALGAAVPAGWLAAHPEIDAPNTRDAAAEPVSSDDQFDQIVDNLIAAIERRRAGEA